jgi:hypothetical protein
MLERDARNIADLKTRVGRLHNGFNRIIYADSFL